MSNQPTSQEFFDKTVRHLHEQGKQAVDVRGACKYRIMVGGQMLMCALGCHIPDEIYTPKMEGKGVLVLMREFSELENIMPPGIDLLWQLQSAHDSTDNWYFGGELNINGIDKLRSIAIKYQLSAAVINELWPDGGESE